MTTTSEKFSQVYADAVLNDAGEARELRWKGERMPLAAAAKLYALIPGYNNFAPNMLTDLAEKFTDHPHGEIEATPGRESSVVVYLHPPIGLNRQVRVFVEENWEADEVDWVTADTLRVWWD